MAKRKKKTKGPSKLLKAYREKKREKSVKGRKAATFSFKDSRGKDRRGPQGRFLSKDDWEANRKEWERRVRDARKDAKNETARLLRERAANKAKRQKTLKRKEAAWRKGTKTKSGKLRSLFTNKATGHARTVADDAVLTSGEIPDAHSVKKLGKFKTYKWVYFGADATNTAENFVMEARQQLPNNVLGSIRIGTSYSAKSGRWVSTPVLPLKANYAQGKDLLSALFRLLAAESGQNIFGEDGDEDVWVEIELLMK